MNPIVLTLLCAVLFGVYDLLIKLASGSGNPTALAFVVQLASTLTLGAFMTRLALTSTLQLPTNPLYALLAGAIIALALNLLFSILKMPGVQPTSFLPFTLIGRNLVFVSLSILLLGSSLTPTRSIGLGLGLISLFLINR